MGDRLPNDAGPKPELPEQLAALRMHRFGPAIHGTVEHHIARRHQRSALGGKAFLEAPYLLAS